MRMELTKERSHILVQTRDSNNSSNYFSTIYRSLQNLFREITDDVYGSVDPLYRDMPYGDLPYRDMPYVQYSHHCRYCRRGFMDIYELGDHIMNIHNNYDDLLRLDDHISVNQMERFPGFQVLIHNILSHFRVVVN